MELRDFTVSKQRVIHVQLLWLLNYSELATSPNKHFSVAVDGCREAASDHLLGSSPSQTCYLDWCRIPNILLSR